MLRETESFIHHLFEAVEPAASPLYLTFTAIHPDGAHPTPSRHVPLGDSAALARTLARLDRANAAGWGAYLGIALRSRPLGRWQRGGREDLAALPALFVDIDQPDDALFRLIRFPLPPTCIVSSGRGYHLYWRLTTPTTDFATADRALRGLAVAFGSDDKMTVAQSMRLPGTRNTKPGREAAWCTVLSFQPDNHYRLADFTPFLPRPVVVRTGRWPGRDASPAWADDAGRQAVIQAVTALVLRELDGHPKPNGWIAARCPCPHCRDRPGMHFSYHPERGIGYCFGKHGKLPLGVLCRLLGVDARTA